jgi:hypothetical protein
LGAVLVLHFSWLSISALPGAVAAELGQFDQHAPTMTAGTPVLPMTDSDAAPCHAMHAQAGSSAAVPLHDGVSKHSHMPCCATQCHCVSGFCAVLVPEAMPSNLSVSHGQDSDFSFTAPPPAPVEFDLRPPIAT